MICQNLRAVACATLLVLIPAHAMAGQDALLESYGRGVTGSFTSAAQAAEDDRYSVVEAEIIRIWPERTDGIWIYQEQAIVNMDGIDPATAKNRPYFQRVGHIYREASGRIVRDNYELPDAPAYAGAWRAPQRFDAISPDQLGKKGCANILLPVATGHWVSHTEDCANSYRGASKMISLGITMPEGFANWDRGFGADGQLVWGPADGGYVFRRR